MDIRLSNRLPQVFIRNDRECFLDPVRKKLIYVTAEEVVRQKIISYLIYELNVPIDMISVEEHLSHYGIKSNKRADIVIHAVDENSCVVPIAIVECKAKGIILGDVALKQVTNYCDLLNCDYALLINENEYYAYHYEQKQNKYIQIKELPKYEDLIKGKYRKYETGNLPKRIIHSEIPKYVAQNFDNLRYEISDQTDFKLACAAFNLMEGLYDTRHKMDAKQYNIFNLIKDYGVRLLSYGNASGGKYSGLYRTFIVEYKTVEFVSIGLSTYLPHSINGKIKTTLNVAIDDEMKSHHALQLVLDDNVVENDNEFSFYHSGRIAIGHQGSGKISELRQFVNKIKPDLVFENKFYMGSLINDKLWRLDDPDVSKLMENLISYALIRDDYRKFMINNKKTLL